MCDSRGASMILVDNREPDKVFKYFEEFEHPIERATLDVGDFLDEEKHVVIERKTVEDFVVSMQTNHLQQQLVRMQETGHKCFLFISGNFDNVHFNSKIHLTSEQLVGMLTSVAARYNVKMVHFSNDKQLVRGVIKLLEKIDDGKELVIHHHVRISKDQTINMLMCVDKIGLIKAEQIKLLYPSIDLLIAALRNGSFQCRGISDKLKDNLKHAFGV